MHIAAARHHVRRHGPPPHPSAVVALAALVWGALAFGAVYPWAYWPLLVLCATSGVLGLVRRREPAPLSRPLALGCALLVAVVLLQLVPMPRNLVAALSPASEAVYAERLVADRAAAPPSAASRDPGTGAANRAHPLSVSPRATLRGLAFLAALAAFLLGASRALDRRDIGWMAGGLVVLGVALALAGLAQKAAAARRIYGLWEPYYGTSPFGPFVNRNHFAGWMVMAIPLGIGYLCGNISGSAPVAPTGWRKRVLWLSSREPTEIALVGFGIVLMALSLVFTLSRSGITCLVAALILVGAVVVRRKIGRVRRTVAVLCLIAVAAIGIGRTGTDTVVRRFAALADPAGAGGRPPIWRATIRLARDFPLAGAGLNTYRTAISPYYQTGDASLAVAEAHSDYLQLAAEGGALLAGAAALLLALFAREVRRRFRESAAGSRDYWVRVGAVTGLVSIGLQELVEFSLQMPANAALFVVLCAVALHRSPPAAADASGRAR